MRKLPISVKNKINKMAEHALKVKQINDELLEYFSSCGLLDNSLDGSINDCLIDMSQQTFDAFGTIESIERLVKESAQCK